MRRNPYIVIEGIDGSGKNLQADILERNLRESGYDPLMVAEPSGFPPGLLLRESLASGKYRAAQPALFLADRIVLQEECIRPALDAGRPVVSVRSFISTLAYQQLDWPLPWLVELHTYLPVKPDFVIYLDVQPEVGLERVGKRKTPTEIYEKVDLLTRVRQNYLELMDPHSYAGLKLKKLLETGVITQIVDTAQTPLEVSTLLWDRLWPRLKH